MSRDSNLKEGQIRLNVFVARRWGIARRKADTLIKEGKVEINGRVVREPWYRVKKEDKLSIEGKVVGNKKNFTYLIFYKPKGVTVTCRDPFSHKIIYDYLPHQYRNLFPVGRLDKNSEGLLILTNNGKLCYYLTHPKFRVEKEYVLKIKGNFYRGFITKCKKGVIDKGEQLKVEKIKIVRFKDNEGKIYVVVREDKKRHLRRLFNKLGFKVLMLKRIRIDGIFLGELKPGEYKKIDELILPTQCTILNR